jgi:Alpha-1,6-glucosidases, pullulanase-type, C-terminal
MTLDRKTGVWSVMGYASWTGKYYLYEVKDNWPILQPLLANPDLKPAQANIMDALANFEEMLPIRRSSPLFRLRTAQDIQDRLTFQMQVDSHDPIVQTAAFDSASGTFSILGRTTAVFVLTQA